MPGLSTTRRKQSPVLTHLYRKWLAGPIAQSTIQTTFVLGLRLVVQAGTLLLVVRMLGPDAFGAFAGVAALAVLMGTFSTFGTHLVLLAEVAKDASRRNEVLAYAVPTTMATGSILFLAYLCLIRIFFNDVGFPYPAALCIGLAELLLLPLFLLPATEQLALEKTARSQLLIIFPLALRTLAAGVVTLAASSQPLMHYSWLYLITAAVALLALWIFKRDAWLGPAQWHWPKIGQLKHSAGYATLAMTAAGPAELDKMLAVKLMPLGASGLYAAASRVIGATVLPVTALLLSAIPKLIRTRENDAKANKRLALWVLIAATLHGLSFAVVLWLLAPWIEWLFGQKYVGMTDMLKWLSIAVPGLALRIATANVLMSMNRPWARAGIQIFGMTALLAAAIILNMKGQIFGMPLALACSEWGMVVIGVLILRRNRII